jgi:hypothetical protein
LDIALNYSLRVLDLSTPPKQAEALKNKPKTGALISNSLTPERDPQNNNKTKQNKKNNKNQTNPKKSCFAGFVFLEEACVQASSLIKLNNWQISIHKSVADWQRERSCDRRQDGPRNKKKEAAGVLQPHTSHECAGLPPCIAQTNTSL